MSSDLGTKLLLFLLSPSFLFAQPNDSGVIPRDTSFTVYSAFSKERQNYPFITIVQPELPAGVVAAENIVYSTVGRRDLRLDIFYPAPGQVEDYPGVVLVHGGGWRSGDRSQQIPLAQHLVARGYVTAAVEYRLSPEALYPAAVHDLKAAIRWLRANAAQYHLDPTQIAILGCSAGGQLAALVGVTNGLAEFEGEGGNPNTSSAVQAIIDIDGLLDFTTPEARFFEDNPDKPSSAGKWFGGRYHEKQEIWKAASPIFYVNAKTPPMLFINSAIPRFHVGGDQVIEKLKTYGIGHEVHTIPDTPHPFWLFHPWFETTVELAASFLNRVFK